MNERIDFKITRPHTADCRGFGWYFPNGFRGVAPVEDRDRAGRARGKRGGYMPHWFVLACNDPRCDALAAVPVSVITNLANERDPSISESR